MVTTREKEREHRHWQYSEVSAHTLKSGQVFMDKGQGLEVIMEITRYIDERNVIVWLCLFVENTRTKERQLFTTRALASVLVDTWATCKEC